MSHAPRPILRLRSLGLFVVAVGLLGLATTGCVRLLEPRANEATYYLLHDPQAWTPPPADTAGLAVGLRRTRMASYLDATRLLIRRGPHRIELSEYHRWAEDLNQGISRTVALALAERAGIRSVETVPWSDGTSFDYLVQLHVLNFEGVGPPLPDSKAETDAPPPEGHSRMVVQWRILDPADDTILARGVTRHQEEGWRLNDYEALASRLGTGLTVLAEDLAERLQSLPRAQTP